MTRHTGFCVNFFRGFTLAEVLITLGIIGVVAALTMPVLINQTNKKELQVAFQKTYSELNQVAKLYYANEGTSFSEDYTTKYIATSNLAIAVKNLMKYFHGGHQYNPSTWWNYGIKSYDIYWLNNKGKNDGTICNNAGYWTNNSGQIYSFNDPATDTLTNGPVICVDTNGQKRPNRYGYDIFLFLFTIDNTVIPMGMEHKNNPTSNSLNNNGFVTGEEYCTYSKNASGGGFSCAYYALNDRSPEDASKSYWKDFLR